MLTTRGLALGLALLGASTAVLAQFNGPAPLAWRWAQPTSVSPVGTPVVDGDKVIVAVGQRVYALDKETGNQRWRYPVGEPINGYFRTQPLMHERTVIVSADNKTVYGIDADTGQSKWEYTALIGIIGQPVVAGRYVVFALSDNSLMALIAENGQPAWETPMKYHEGLSPHIAAYGSNVLTINGSGELASVNVNTRKVDWKAPFNQLGTDAAPIVVGDVIYINSGPYAVALNAGTGRARWQADTRETLAFSPAVSSTGIAVVTREGKAMFYDLNGRAAARGSFELGSLPSVRPSAVGDKFVFPTTNGALNLYNPTDGALLWSFMIRPLSTATANPTPPTMGPGRGPGIGAPTNNTNAQRVLAVPASGPAVVAGNTLLVLAQDGSLLAFDAETGVDLTPPAVKMLWPNSGDQVNGQTLEMLFSIEDEATGINQKGLTIEIDGKAMDYEYGRDGIAVVRISALGKNKPLANGRKQIKVTVSDWLGNQSVSTYSLYIDNNLRPTTRPTNTNPGGPGFGPGGGPGGGGRGLGDG